MHDRIDPFPFKEAIAAREALKKGIDTYLVQRGLDTRELLKRNSSFQINISCNSEYSRDIMPGKLIDFIDRQYPGRRVDVVRLTIDYEKIFLDVYPSDLPGTNFIKSMSEDPDTGDLIILIDPEKEAKWKSESKERVKAGYGIVVPHQELALSSFIYLDVGKMEYGILVGSASDWIMQEPGTYPGNEVTGSLDPDIVTAISTVIPDNDEVLAELGKPEEERDFYHLPYVPSKQITIHAKRFPDD